MNSEVITTASGLMVFPAIGVILGTTGNATVTVLLGLMEKIVKHAPQDATLALETVVTGASAATQQPMTSSGGTMGVTKNVEMGKILDNGLATMETQKLVMAALISAKLRLVGRVQVVHQQHQTCVSRYAVMV